MNGAILAAVIELVPEAAKLIERLGKRPKDSDLLLVVLAAQTQVIKEGFVASEKQLQAANRKLDYLRTIAENGRIG